VQGTGWSFLCGLAAITIHHHRIYCARMKIKSEVPSYLWYTPRIEIRGINSSRASLIALSGRILLHLKVSFEILISWKPLKADSYACRLSEAKISYYLTAPQPFDLYPLEASGQLPPTQPDVVELTKPLLRGIWSWRQRAELVMLGK
jgi:hypothetical protein